jgi:hypothetical protein
MAENAILLQRPGRMHWQRQAKACAAYLDEHGYMLVGKADSHADALALVLNGVASVVVAASAAEDDERLEALLAQVPRVNARFEVCRPTGRPADQGRSHTEEIVRRMGEHGGTTEEIVRLAGIAEGRVRAILRRIRRNPR